MADAPTPVPASDAARQLADEHGIDLATLTPTGANGVVLADVEAAVAGQAPPRRYRLEGDGPLTFRSAGFLDGAAVTVRPGEAVSADTFARVPKKDQARFAPLTD